MPQNWPTEDDMRKAELEIHQEDLEKLKQFYEKMVSGIIGPAEEKKDSPLSKEAKNIAIQSHSGCVAARKAVAKKRLEVWNAIREINS